MTKNQTHILLVAAPILWVVLVSSPEVIRDRIFPFDSAVIAANGALFQSLFANVGDFFTSPIDWLWDYYSQYPALSVRRHPPLFGIVTGVVYSVVGVSAIAAKTTVMLFACAFALGTFFLAQRILTGYFLASCTAVLVVASPTIAMHFRSVWLDIPALAFAVWAVYFYVARLHGNDSIRNVLAIVVFTVLALYTYQLAGVFLAGVFAHLLFNEWRTIYKDRSLLICAAVFIILMLPLAAFTIYFAMDNLLATTGTIPNEWNEFATTTYAEGMITDRVSLTYWTEYAKLIVESYPVQSAGLGLWLALWFARKPSAAETVLFVCVGIAYFGFSSLPVKVPRYTLYMMLPASFLTVAAMRDAFALLPQRFRAKSLYAGLVVLFGAILQGTLISVHEPYRYLSQMIDPVTAILSKKPHARILYSGRHDAAFVFYVRSFDEQRTAMVHRASVQLVDPAELRAYVQRENINYIVLEKENTGSKPLDETIRFREATLNFIDGNLDFSFRADYRLPYGIFEEDATVLLGLYERSK